VSKTLIYELECDNCGAVNHLHCFAKEIKYSGWIEKKIKGVLSIFCCKECLEVFRKL